jgi:hypothetical protein
MTAAERKDLVISSEKLYFRIFVQVFDAKCINEEIREIARRSDLPSGTEVSVQLASARVCLPDRSE